MVKEKSNRMDARKIIDSKECSFEKNKIHSYLEMIQFTRNYRNQHKCKMPRLTMTDSYWWLLLGTVTFDNAICIVWPINKNDRVTHIVNMQLSHPTSTPMWRVQWRNMNSMDNECSLKRCIQWKHSEMVSRPEVLCSWNVSYALKTEKKITNYSVQVVNNFDMNGFLKHARTQQTLMNHQWSSIFFFLPFIHRIHFARSLDLSSNPKSQIDC